jgi:phytoene synthase
MTTAETEAAYRECEQITRRQARNFSYGIRLLPVPKRRALSAVYATARRIDDIGDGTLPIAEKVRRLNQIRAALRRLRWDNGDDPVLTALADTARRMPIPLTAFDELVDGCAADVHGREYHTSEGLIWYCRCVAGSIGRLSLGVFGLAEPDRIKADRTKADRLRTDRATDEGRATGRAWETPRGLELRRASTFADALGVALQLTNILRDLVEDRLNGRVYLPAEDLDRFGCTLHLTDQGFVDPPQRLISLVRFEAERAERWYENGLRLLPMLDRRSAACTAAMAGIYRRLLWHIAADPLAVMRGRLALTRREKVWVAARSLGRPA